MEAWKCCVLVFGLILVVAVQSGWSIQCYVCNSGEKFEGADCSDVERLKKTNYLKDCGDMEVEDRVENGTYKYCRIFTQDVLGEERIIRQCASGGRLDRCIERTGTKGIKLHFCHCDQDGCNSASALSSPVAMVMGVVVATWAVLAHRT